MEYGRCFCVYTYTKCKKAQSSFFWFSSLEVPRALEMQFDAHVEQRMRKSQGAEIFKWNAILEPKSMSLP